MSFTRIPYGPRGTQKETSGLVLVVLVFVLLVCCCCWCCCCGGVGGGGMMSLETCQDSFQDLLELKAS